MVVQNHCLQVSIMILTVIPMTWTMQYLLLVMAQMNVAVKSTGWSRILGAEAGVRKVTYRWLATEATTVVSPVWQAFRWFDQIHTIKCITAYKYLIKEFVVFCVYLQHQ